MRPSKAGDSRDKAIYKTADSHRLLTLTISAPMILHRLRQETSEQHAALEAGLALLDPSLSRADYGALLEKFFGYYAPLEAKLKARQEWTELGLDYSTRQKCPQLERDLAVFGVSAGALAALPRCTEMPPLVSVQQVLGSLYVIEGATLGGQIITRHLEKNFGLTPETGGAFFAGYGAETGPRWKEFCALLTAAADRLHGENEIVASANRTFETLRHWLFPARVR